MSAPDPDPGGIDAAKAKAGDEARAILDYVAAFAHRINGVLAMPGALHASARQLIDALAGDAATLRAEPGRRDHDLSRLLATLAAMRHVDGILATLRPTLRQFLAQAGPLVSTAEPVANPAASRFLTGDENHRALAALAQLDAFLADPRFATLLQHVENVESAANVAAYRPEVLWDEYTADPAVFDAALAVVGGGEGTAADDGAKGALPAELARAIDAEPFDDGYLTTALRDYQVFGAKYALHQQRSMLGDAMGLGKTLQAIAAMAHLATTGSRHFLVVGPPSAQPHWLREIAECTSLPAHHLDGESPAVAAERWYSDGGIAVTSFQSVGTLLSIAGDLDLLVVDEAHRIRHPDSPYARHVGAVAAAARRTLYLTSRPTAEPLGDVPPQAGHLRRDHYDVLTELPAKIEVDDWVRFTAADDAAYTQTVLSGNLTHMRIAAFHAANSAKLERLVDLVDAAREDGRKVVVFSAFPAVLETIHRKLGAASIGPLTGSMSLPDRQAFAGTFARLDGHVVLLCQLDEHGSGLDLRAASVVIIAEPQWTPDAEERAVAQVHWAGQLRSVLIHRLLGTTSVDDRVREFRTYQRLLPHWGGPRPGLLDDPAVPLPDRIVFAERHRFGIA